MYLYSMFVGLFLLLLWFLVVFLLYVKGSFVVIDFGLKLPIFAHFHSQTASVSLGLLLGYHAFLVPHILAVVLRVKDR